MAGETKPRLLIDFRHGRYVLEIDTRAIPSLKEIPSRIRLECRTPRSQVLLGAAALALEQNCERGRIEPVDLSRSEKELELLMAVYERAGHDKPKDICSAVRVGWASGDRGLGTRGVDFYRDDKKQDWPPEVVDIFKNLFVVSVRGHAFRLTLNQNAVSVGSDDISVCGLQDLLRSLRTIQKPKWRAHGRMVYVPLDATVESFRKWYLGTRNRPVAFGGRSAEMSALNDWLDQADGPPYLLLTGPAGYGKSALLVRWMDQVKLSDAYEVVFYPISVRFDTNRPDQLFKYLTDRLAMLHGEAVAVGNVPSSALRDLALHLLSKPLPNKKRLLVIVDGLDEAAEWSPAPNLFPLEPHSGVRVVVSARTHAMNATREWLAQLGWTEGKLCRLMTLGILDGNAIMHVVSQLGVGFRGPTDQEKAAAQLLRLSGGEPFLLGLYVETLKEKLVAWTARRPTVNDAFAKFTHASAGLHEFLGRWQQEQRALVGKEFDEDVPQTVLNVLATAKAPLSFDDIQQLVAPFGAVSGHKLRRALAVISRFIIRDGHPPSYVFCHPVLRDYYEQQLTTRDRTRFRQSFASTGNNLLASLKRGDVQPEQASPYLVRYLGVHLQELHAPVEFMRDLTHEVWMRSWHALEGNYRGFLNDVHRVWRAAETHDLQSHGRGNTILPLFGTEVRCALLEASIASIGTNVNPELLQALLQTRIWSPLEAKAYVETQRYPVDQARILLTYARSVLAHYPSEHVDWALEQATLVAKKILPSDESDKVMIRIAECYAASDSINNALVGVELIQDPALRGEAFARVSEHATKHKASQLLERAETLVRSAKTSDSRYSDRAVAVLAAQWAAQGNIRKAESIAHMIWPPCNPQELLTFFERKFVLCELSMWLATRGKNTATRTRDRSLAARFKPIGDILFHLHPFQELAEERMREDGDLFDKTVLYFRDFGGYDDGTGNEEDCLQFEKLVAKIRTTKPGARRLQLLKEARDCACSCGNRLHGVTGMAAVASALPRGEEKQRVIRKAIAMASEMASQPQCGDPEWVFQRDRPQRVTAFVRIASVVEDRNARHALLRCALEETMAIEDLHLRTHAVSSLAQEAARNGPRDLALRMVESVPKGPCREEAIAQVVSVLPAQSERQDLMNDVMRRLRVYMKHTPSLALDALERIVCVEAIGACVNEAVDLILGLEDALRREELLLRLAEHIELRPSYERLLQSLLSACRTGAYRKERILTCLGQAVVCAYQEGEDAWSLKTLDSLPHGPEKTRTMVQLAHCARDQQLARELTLKALDIVSASPEEYCRRNDGTLPLLLSRLLAVGETKPGLQLVRKCIPHLWHKQKAVLLTAKCADPAEKHAVIEDTLQALLRHAGAPAKVALGHLMNAVHDMRHEDRLDAVLDCIAESLPPQNGAVGLAKLAHLFPEQRDGMLREALHVSLSEATLSPFQSNRDIFRVDRLRTRFPNYLMTPLHTVMAECASAGLVEDVTAAALAQNSIEELIGACVAIQGKLPTAAFQSIIRQGLLKCEVISGSPATCALDLVKLSDSLTNSDDAGAVLGKACSLAIAIPDVGDLLNLVIELTERGVAWSHTKHLLDKAPSMPSGHIRLTLGLLGKHAMQSHHLVSAVFHIAARQGRSFLLSRLAQFSGAIHALGGIAALEEAASSINEVGQWRS